MKFDVVMPTLNSESRVGGRIFKIVLNRIYSEIPVDRLIVVDDGSKDGTLEIVREFDNVLILKGLGSLGKARELGIKSVETPWFYFIDDDNVIPRGFHSKMLKYIDDEVGMIHAVPYNPFESWYAKHEEILSRIYSLFRRAIGATRRGYTGATLVRTEAVKHITIPPIPRMEDWYIKKWLERNGWKVKTALDVVVAHFSKLSDRAHYLDGYYMYQFNFVSFRRMVVAWLLNYPKSLLTATISGDFNITRNIPKRFYLRLKGYIDARSNVKSSYRQ